MHKTSYRTMAKFIGALDKQDPLYILDVGSLRVGKQAAYADLITSDNWTYVGLDVVSGPNVDIVADSLYGYPFLDNNFDIIICGQVLEHVRDPIPFMAELFRVLKIGGRLCIIAPSAGYEHHRPDYRRIMPDGMRYLLEQAGFVDTDVTLTTEGIWRDCVGHAIKQGGHYVN